MNPRGDLLVIAMLASFALPVPAAACTCVRGSVESALLGAALVAELEIIEVGRVADPDSDMTSQPMRARVVRVLATETSIADGDEIVFVHETCNSSPYDHTEAGSRFVAFLGRRGARLAYHFCSFFLHAWEPVPHLLLEARRRWLARR